MGCNFPKERWQLTESYAQELEASGYRENIRKLVKSTGELAPIWWMEANVDQETSRGFQRENCIVNYIRCGKCLGCRMDEAREWAIRQTAEAALYDKGSNWFGTFTLDDEHMTYNRDGIMTLEEDRIEKFMNTVRKHAERDGHKSGIRKFGCAEYGSKNLRPHYHINFFNLPIQKLGWELKPLYTTKQGNILYRCTELEEMWGRGIVTIGKFTADSASYVARYVTKKIKDQADDSYYTDVGLIPPYRVTKCKPGIGHDYFIAHQEEIYKSDKITVGKFRAVRPANYSDDLLKQIHYDQWMNIKADRQNKALIAEKLRQTKENISGTESRIRQEEKLQRTLKFELPRNIE